ncbi:MAG: hypothetical protein P4L66_08435 [Acetobacteraceae bacterium]|nr:hypothetical protein [Acetobacteraceae bacterium]
MIVGVNQILTSVFLASLAMLSPVCGFAATDSPTIECTFLPDSQSPTENRKNTFKITFKQTQFGMMSVSDKFGDRDARSFIQNNVLYVIEYNQKKLGTTTMIYLEPNQEILAIRSMIGTIDLPGAEHTLILASNKGRCDTSSPIPK